MSAPKPAEVVGGRVVVVRTRHTSWTSPFLTEERAEGVAAIVTLRVRECGDSPDLFSFECSGGRVAEVRGRDVVSIERHPALRAPAGPAVDPEQRYRPVVVEPPALTAEEIAESVVRS